VHPALVPLPPRIRQIVLEEIAAGELLVGREHSNLDRVFSVHTSKFTGRVRAAIWWRIREEIEIDGQPASFPWIGRLFKRNHSSVLSAVKKHPVHMIEWAAAKQKLYEDGRLSHLADAATHTPNIVAIVP
jgi:hypothetical protein